MTERYYSWKDAEAIAKNDPEIDLSGSGPLFTPSEFIEEDIPEESDAEVAQLEPEAKPEHGTRSTV